MTFRPLAAAWLSIIALVSAMSAASAGAQSVNYADDPGTVVVRYSLIHGEIGESVRGPSLEIYGDGRARVQTPAYMKHAGDHDLQLSRDEIAELVNDFSAAGLLDVDTRALHAETRHAAQEEHVGITRTDGIQEVAAVRSTSDPSVTIIEINVVRGQGAAARSVRKVIRWTNLQRDARRFKSIAALQRLAEAENRLTSVMHRAK